MTLSYFFLPLQTPVSAPTNNNEVIGKGTDGKDGALSKKNKGTLENAGTVENKTGDGVRATSGSGNDGGSHRFVYPFQVMSISL